MSDVSPTTPNDALDRYVIYEGPKGWLWAWWLFTGAASGAMGGAAFDPGLEHDFWSLTLFLVAVLALRKALFALERRVLDPKVVMMGFATCAFWLAFACQIVGGLVGGGSAAPLLATVAAGAIFGALHSVVSLVRVRRMLLWACASAGGGALAILAGAAFREGLSEGVAPGAAGALDGAAVGITYAALTGAALLWHFWDASGYLAVLGDECLDRGDFKRALANYDYGLFVHPGDPDLHLGRSRAYAALGLEELAEAERSRALEIEPRLAALYNDRGNNLRMEGDNVRALALYAKAVAAQPDFAMAHGNRGVLYDKLGWLDEALAEYDRALTIDPAYANGYSNRAFIHYRRGEYARAIEDCDRAVAIEPDHAAAYSNRGLCYAAVGEAERAAADFRRALELHCPSEVWREAREGLRALGHDPGPGRVKWLIDGFRGSKYH